MATAKKTTPPSSAPLSRWQGWVPEKRRTSHSVHVLVAHSHYDPRIDELIPCDCDFCKHAAGLRVG